VFSFLKVERLQVINCMSLFPNKDILTKEINSWKVFANSLDDGNRELCRNMINDCYKYAAAINAKGEPFPAESLIMALLRYL
jgi:hypothetical protein